MAFILGCSAIIMWGVLALFTVYTKGIPPLQLSAMTFVIATIIGLIYSFGKGGLVNVKRIYQQPISVILLGSCGLFGYHLFYFIALKNAPPETASLIAYLWPLLIVLMSTMVLGGRLTMWHILGALMGLLGCYLLVTDGKGFAIEAEYKLGYLAALSCAFIWSSYSVLSRKFANVPTEVVTIYCLITAILSYIAHLFLETTVVNLTSENWLGILGLGIGPVGIAFFCWDYAMKNGPVKVLGVASYFAPLISTLVLGLTGQAEITSMIWIGCSLITIGALLSAKEYLFKK